MWIALVINEWNMSRDIEGKAAVRRLLLSEETVKMNEALKELNRIADERFKRECGALNHTDMNIGFIAAVLSGATQFGKEADAIQNALIDKARAELAFYLDRVFRADHLEELPVPEFGYEFSDQKQIGHVQGAATPAKKVSWPPTW